MTQPPSSQEEMAYLRQRVGELEATLDAIRSGEVDALVVEGSSGPQIYTLARADQGYRELVEAMGDGAALVTQDGLITYCNPALERLAGRPRKELVGSYLKDHLVEIEDLALTLDTAATDGVLTRQDGLQRGAEEPLPIQLSFNSVGTREEAVVCVTFTDLSARQLTETLLASERLARSVMEQSGESMLVCDRNLRVLRANGRALQLCRGDPLSRPLGEVLPLQLNGESAGASAEKGLEQRIKTVMVERLPLHGLTASAIDDQGQGVDLLLSCTALLDEREQVIGCVLVMSDISALQQSQQRLALSEAKALRERDRAQQYLDVAEVMLVALNGRGEIMLLNRHAEAILGHGAEALLGKDWFDSCLPVHSREAVRQVFKAMMAGEVDIVSYYETPVLTAGGEERLIAWHNTLLRDQSGLIGTLASGEDITERRRAEAELEQHRHHLEDLVRQRTADLHRSEGQMRVMLESLAEGLILIDARGLVQVMNPEALRMLGWSQQEVLGADARDLIRLLDAKGLSMPFEASCTYQVLESGEVQRAQEQWLERRDGSRFLAACIASPILDAGEVRGVVTAFQDITEYKQTEHLRNELIARVGHELRTPLAGILGAVELLRRRRDMAEEKQTQLLEILAADSGRLKLLVEDFSELRRQLAGDIDYRIEPLALPPLLQAAIDRAAASDVLHRFTLEVPDTLPEAMADGLRLPKVIDRLLDNALKFSPKGGEIRIAARGVENELQISVSDQGIGMPSEVLEMVFMPLFQTEETDTRRFGGLGLGLTLVKAIVEDQGGRVWAESEFGKGSTFYFTLPMSKGNFGLES